MSDGFPTRRMRRLRQNATLRELLASVRLDKRDLIAPMFVCTGSGQKRPIEGLAQQYQLSPDMAAETAKAWRDLGLRAVLLFGIPDRKDSTGSSAYDPAGPVPQAAARIKRTVPDMLVIADVCLCEYTDHGHCGPIYTRPDGVKDVDNDATLALLSRAAVAYAQAGVDIVAPSDMMDGRVAAIRTALDEAGLLHIPILSYAVKFASSLYGPFRHAAECAPSLATAAPTRWTLSHWADRSRDRPGYSRGRRHGHGQARRGVPGCDCQGALPV